MQGILPGSQQKAGQEQDGAFTNSKHGRVDVLRVLLADLLSAT